MCGEEEGPDEPDHCRYEESFPLDDSVGVDTGTPSKILYGLP